MNKAHTLSIPSSLWQRIRYANYVVVRLFVEFLIRNDCLIAAMVIGTLLMEPLEAIRAAFSSFANLKKHFNFYEMNPTTISEEQSKKVPILLLHGNFHDQSAWLSLGRILKKSGIGPVYTVNLPNGDITQKDFEIIQRKIDEIKTDYQRFNAPVNIDVIGHSRGGDIASSISEGIRKIIKIGSVLEQEPANPNHIYEIIGRHDILETRPSLCASDRQHIINTGHLGLLYTRETHHTIIKFLQS